MSGLLFPPEWPLDLDQQFDTSAGPHCVHEVSLHTYSSIGLPSGSAGAVEVNVIALPAIPGIGL